MGTDHLPTVMQSEEMAKPQIQRPDFTFTLCDLQSDHHGLCGLQHAGRVNTNWAGSSFAIGEILPNDFTPNWHTAAPKRNESRLGHSFGCFVLLCKKIPLRGLLQI